MPNAATHCHREQEYGEIPVRGKPLKSATRFSSCLEDSQTTGHHHYHYHYDCPYDVTDVSPYAAEIESTLLL